MTDQTTKDQELKCAFCGGVPPPPAIATDDHKTAICFNCVRNFAAFDSQADLTALRASLQWQPIETARPGELLLVHDDGYIGKGMLIDGEWLDVECGRDDAFFDPPPTHWMPLPAPPTPEGSKEGQ